MLYLVVSIASHLSHWPNAWRLHRLCHDGKILLLFFIPTEQCLAVREPESCLRTLGWEWFAPLWYWYISLQILSDTRALEPFFVGSSSLIPSSTGIRLSIVSLQVDPFKKSMIESFGSKTFYLSFGCHKDSKFEICNVSSSQVWYVLFLHNHLVKVTLSTHSAWKSI